MWQSAGTALAATTFRARFPSLPRSRPRHNGRVIPVRAARRALASVASVASVALVALSGLQPRVDAGQAAAAAPALLPRVAQATTPPDAAPFVLENPVRIVVPSPTRRLTEIAVLLGDVVRARTGFRVRVETGGAAMAPGAIVIDASSAAGTDESYDLAVDATAARITGPPAAVRGDPARGNERSLCACHRSQRRPAAGRPSGRGDAFMAVRG